MIARDEDGRPVVGVPVRDSAAAWQLLQQMRDQLRHRGRPVPVWLEELVRDLRLMIALDHAAVTDVGHGGAVQGPLAGRWLTVREVVQLTGKSAETVRRHARDGVLAGAVQTAGGQWLVPLAAIEEGVKAA